MLNPKEKMFRVLDMMGEVLELNIKVESYKKQLEQQKTLSDNPHTIIQLQDKIINSQVMMLELNDELTGMILEDLKELREKGESTEKEKIPKNKGVGVYN